MEISPVFAALVYAPRTGVRHAMTMRSRINARNLSSTERALLEFTATGKILDLRSGHPDLDNPGNAAKWKAKRNIRANFLTSLLTGDLAPRTEQLRAIRLRGARITGAVDLEARKLLCPLLLHDCCFDEPIDLSEAEAISIRFPGCRVPSLDARQLRTTGNVELTRGFATRGEISMVGAHIGGQLNLSEASLTNHNGPALSAQELIVDQSMASDGFTARGEVSLVGAHIGGELAFIGACLTNHDGIALNADDITVDQHMLCCKGFTACGETRMRAAHISGQLNLSEASLINHDGSALNADNLAVDRDVLCLDGFTAYGMIHMPGAHIGGQIAFSKTSLSVDEGPALVADMLTVREDMLFINDSTADGGIRMRGAHISEVLDLSECSLKDSEGLALDLQQAVIGSLHLPDERPAGAVNLIDAKVDVLHDDQAGWPKVMHLRNFVYGSFDNSAVSVRARLHWLRRHDEPFTPQIYDQLADVYRRAGEDGAARKVLIAKQWLRRKPYNPLSWLWWVTVGYGYRTWQAFVWAAVLTVVGALVFKGAYPVHMVALTAHPPQFQSVIYTLDVMLPIGGLGQKSAWQVTDGYLDWYWGLAIAGWVLSAAVVAGLTGILKRD